MYVSTDKFESLAATCLIRADVLDAIASITDSISLLEIFRHILSTFCSVICIVMHCRVIWLYDPLLLSSRLLRYVQSRFRRGRCSSRSLSVSNRPRALSRRHGRHGQQGLLRRRRGAIEERYVLSTNGIVIFLAKKNIWSKLT